MNETGNSIPILRSDDLLSLRDKMRQWIPIGFATVIFSGLSVLCAIKSTGFLEADACTHFQYARFALAEPYYFVNVWGRPFVTALYAIPAVLAGRIGVRITSLVCALLIATIAWRIARDQKYRLPALAFIFTLAQPLVFLHSFSELTELPFALLLGLAFWAYCRRQWFVMALLAGLLPAARPEGFGFLILTCVALAAHRRWRWIIILPIPLLVWTYAGWRLYGRPVYSDSLSRHLPADMQWLMWLRHEWPYADKSAYASGSIFHFIALLPVIVSPLLLPFFGIGVWQSIWPGARRHGGTVARWGGGAEAGREKEMQEARMEDGKGASPSNTPSPVTHSGFLSSLRAFVPPCLRAFPNQLLIAAIPLMILIGHSLLYWLGRMASNGELRYMLIVAPFWGLLSAKGWEWTFGRLDWKHPFLLAGLASMLPLAVNGYYHVVPIYPSIDSAKASAVARWYRSSHFAIDYPRILCSNPEIPYWLDVSFTDGGQMREWRKSVVAKAQPGTLLIWDPVYGLYNADTHRVVTLDEIRAAGWIDRPDLAEPVNALGGDQWHIFLSPKSIFGRGSPSVGAN
jgi:hypothetical protein